MAQQEEEDWEAAGVAELQKLSIKQPSEPEPQAASGSNTQEQQQQQQLDQEQDRRAAAPVDHAIVEALLKGRETDRKTITEIENMVIKFITSTSDLLEFPSSFGTYQKMLAHRVAQSYGLQSSTIDYEDGHGRVIGTRTKDTRLRKVRLTKMDLTAPELQQHRDMPGGAPKILFRRPGAHDHGRGPMGGDYKANFSLQSMKEREEDYNRARERLGIGGGEAMPPGLQAGMRAAMQAPQFPPGRGGYGGRGPMMQGRDISGRGRGRKAVFRDRDRELQDPDYVRGFNRDGSQQSYDQAGYDESYPEYPAMQQWGAAPYRVPPPPPPPHPASPYQPSGPTHKAPALPASPAVAMAMYPAGAPAMAQAVGQQQMAAMARQPFPAGMQMAPYPMPGYPGPMAYHGMPGQQAMYAAPGMVQPYPGQMGAAYGYMDASGAPDVSGMAAHAHQQGAYPMYAAGYALYQPHMAGMPGGMRAVAMPGMAPPGAGMEHMYHAGQYAYPMPPHGVPPPHSASSEGKHHQHQGGRPQSGHSSNAGHAEASGSGAAAGGASRHDSSASNAT